MDLPSGSGRLIIILSHTDKRCISKVVWQCDLRLALSGVDDMPPPWQCLLCQALSTGPRLGPRTRRAVHESRNAWGRRLRGPSRLARLGILTAWKSPHRR